MKVPVSREDYKKLMAGVEERFNNDSDNYKYKIIDSVMRKVLGVEDSESAANGGIDFNPQISETVIEDSGRVFQMPPVTLEDLEFYMDAPGFEPVIINVSPPQPLPVILGYAKEPEELAAL